MSCKFFLFTDTGKFSTSQQGNCLRLFELQTVSADALRILFNKVDGTLKDKIERYCRSSPRSSWKKELLSRIYTYLFFIISLHYLILIHHLVSMLIHKDK